MRQQSGCTDHYSVSLAGLTDSDNYMLVLLQKSIIASTYQRGDGALFQLPSISEVMTSRISKQSKRWGQRLAEAVGLISYLAALLLTSTANRKFSSAADTVRGALP